MRVNIYRQTSQDVLSLQELALYHAIIGYRAAQGLAPIPLSKGLTATAGRHVVDSRENIWGEGKLPPAGANLHSWSDAPYYADHRAPQAMWEAPARLGTGYTASGYEISAAGVPNGAAALAGWKASPGHNEVLTNRGIWAGLEFAAIGVGLDASPGPGPYGGRVYHVWFGEAPDPGGPPDILGTPRSDVIRGTAFADRISAGGGADTVSGGLGNDVLSGGGGNENLNGGAGNDTLNGGGGADIMRGVAGNDIYVVDHPGDRVIETGGQGTDTVRASLGYTLPGYVEVLILTGSAGIAGIGSPLANVIRGNIGANGLYGAGGNDRLVGGDGNDRLDGGPGADRMEGGGGNDVHVGNDRGDRVIEAAGQGTDTVRSAVSHSLAVNVENLILGGSASINGAGNAAANAIRGNGGDNVLNGGLGGDRLAGGLGRDVLFGAAGADTFVIASPTEAGSGAIRDRIADFAPGSDRIDLSGIDADTTLAGNQAFDFIESGAFSNAPGGLIFVGGIAAGDVNGDGRADFEIAVTGITALAGSDFIL